jgi:hypothetical protein
VPKLSYTYGRVRVETPYNAAFVDELKSTIPSRYRQYDPHSKAWDVFRPYVTTVRDLTRRYWQFIEESGAEAYEDERDRDRQDRERAEREQQEHWNWHQQRTKDSPFGGSSNRTGGQPADREYREQSGRMQYRERRADGSFGPWQGWKGNAQHANPSSTGDFATLFVTNAAPKEVVKAAYHALSKLTHPDLLGPNATQAQKDAAAERMKPINEAYRRVCALKGWK